MPQFINGRNVCNICFMLASLSLWNEASYTAAAILAVSELNSWPHTSSVCGSGDPKWTSVPSVWFLLHFMFFAVRNRPESSTKTLRLRTDADVSSQTLQFQNTIPAFVWLLHTSAFANSTCATLFDIVRKYLYISLVRICDAAVS